MASRTFWSGGLDGLGRDGHPWGLAASGRQVPVPSAKSISKLQRTSTREIKKLRDFIIQLERPLAVNFAAVVLIMGFFAK